VAITVGLNATVHRPLPEPPPDRDAGPPADRSRASPRSPRVWSLAALGSRDGDLDGSERVRAAL